MEPRIEIIEPRKLVGMRMNMSLSEDKTPILWRQFMPRRKEIGNIKGSELYSLQVFDKSLNINDFTPNTIFEKWAAVEVKDTENIPEGMESIEITGGKYAVFLYKGTVANFHIFSNYIFGTWLPASTYALDDRIHFTVMGDKYKNNDPESEEEIWIPING